MRGDLPSVQGSGAPQSPGCLSCLLDPVHSPSYNQLIDVKPANCKSQTRWSCTLQGEVHAAAPQVHCSLGLGCPGHSKARTAVAFSPGHTLGPPGSSETYGCLGPSPEILIELVTVEPETSRFKSPPATLTDSQVRETLAQDHSE